MRTKSALSPAFNMPTSLSILVTRAGLAETIPTASASGTRNFYTRIYNVVIKLVQLPASVVVPKSWQHSPSGATSIMRFLPYVYYFPAIGSATASVMNTTSLGSRDAMALIKVRGEMC